MFEAFPEMNPYTATFYRIVKGSIFDIFGVFLVHNFEEEKYFLHLRHYTLRSS